MGFNSVFRALQDVFPEVDARLLRAVAIEHPKDADAAVEAILVEVLPYLSSGSTANSSSNDKEILLDSKGDVEEANDTSRTDDAFTVDSKCSDEVVNDSSCYETNGGHNQACGDYGNEELISLGQSEKSGVKVGLDSPSTSSTHDSVATNDHDHDQVCGNSGNEEIISSGNYQQSTVNIGTDQSSHITLTASKLGDFGKSGIIYDHSSVGFEDNDSNMFNGGSCEEKSCADGNLLEVEVSTVELAPSPVQELEPSALESSLESVVVLDDLITGCETPEPHAYFDAAPKEKSYVSVMAHDEDVSTLNSIATRSGQICRIDLLEDIIEDARCNKKILFSAMESVLSLMREVELQEKAAEQAKEEAVRGGLDIHDRVEELKELLSRAREANDMHAGEVYGEKAILATEVRELQSRLLSLSDERDTSLAIIEEMRRTLEARFAEAERERKAAEQEKLGKEGVAHKALAEQKLIMEKVLEESEILKQEAEENSKLQEFLMDRGRVVDMLQGEISVICKDVKLLKEKFDKRVPLSKSLSSYQTSCILASSSSSVKSLAPDQVPEQANPSESPKKTSPSASVDDSLSSMEEKAKDDRKAFVDAGWEFFDNREFYM